MHGPNDSKIAILRSNATRPATPLTASHLLVHRSPDKKRFYDEANPLLWSDELECWATAANEVVLQILRHKDFHVVDYGLETEQLSNRLNVDLRATCELLECVPLALEASRHGAVRKMMAMIIRERSGDAFQAFADCARQRVHAEFVPGAKFDIVAKVFAPSVACLMFVLAGVCLDVENEEMSPTQVFYRTMSINRRKVIDREVSALLNRAKSCAAAEEATMKAAMVVVGSDSLLGSISESFRHEINRNAGSRLSEMEWSDGFSVTAIPYVERIAVRHCRIAGRDIEAGQRIRLYLDTFEYGGADTRDFFFGAGRHVCLGKSLSFQAWQVLTSLFHEFDLRVEIQEVRYRQSDYVFNVPDAMEVVVRND
jgi:cytochrome P450